MNAMAQTRMHAAHHVAPISAKAGVVAVVVSAHLALLLFWAQYPHGNAVLPHELTVSFAMAAQAPQPAIVQPRKAMPAPEIAPAETPLPSTPVEPARAEPAPSAATAAIADAEPDYKASYLNNTPPAYPLMARRMGLQGKVVLSVEVLAAGICGEVKVHQSSGHPMLDNAALQAVKGWRFMPARQAGHSVDKWFMIPINFSLKDQAA